MQYIDSASSRFTSLLSSAPDHVRTAHAAGFEDYPEAGIAFAALSDGSLYPFATGSCMLPIVAYFNPPDGMCPEWAGLSAHAVGRQPEILCLFPDGACWREDASVFRDWLNTSRGG